MPPSCFLHSPFATSDLMARCSHDLPTALLPAGRAAHALQPSTRSSLEPLSTHHTHKSLSCVNFTQFAGGCGKRWQLHMKCNKEQSFGAMDDPGEGWKGKELVNLWPW